MLEIYVCKYAWFLKNIYGPRGEKACLRACANNKGADQPARLRSLISTFVIHFLESTIYKPSTREILIFSLVSVAEETGLSLVLSETRKTDFVAMRPICWVSYFLNPSPAKPEFIIFFKTLKIQIRWLLNSYEAI